MRRPTTAQDRELVLETLKFIVAGVESTLGRSIEFVLHDLTKPGESVVAIANGHVTGRTVGSAIISGPYDDLGLQKLAHQENYDSSSAGVVVSGYKTRTREGNELESTTLLLRDAKGEAYAAFCINSDRTKLLELKNVVNNLINDYERSPVAPRENKFPTMDEVVSEIIQSAIAESGKPVSKMTKEEKLQSLSHMRNRGLFLIRGGVELAASSLAVSRFTIYNYLDELSSSPGSGSKNSKSTTKGRPRVRLAAS